jgi:nucleolar MIF4G domain-containing protein 1
VKKLFYSNMNKQFLSRKTMRKNKRKEKKQKMDQFYKGSQKNTSIKKGNRYEKELDEKDEDVEFDDEEINSSIASIKDSEDSDAYEEINKSDEKIKRYKKNKTKTKANKDIDGEHFSKDINNSDNNIRNMTHDEIAAEIKQLEKKLGFKETRRYDAYKKRLAMENHDEDLIDFLDGIDTYVQKQKSIPKAKLKNETKPKKQKETIETLEDIKSQSKLFKKTDNSEETLTFTFQKDITSLLNKISEANLNLMLPDFMNKLDEYNKVKSRRQVTYDTITKFALKLMLDSDVTNLPITSCICSYISLLHYKYGNNFMLYFIKTLIERFEDLRKVMVKSGLKNFIFVIIQFYMFQNISSKLYYDIIKLFIDNFNDTFSELLLILLNHIGIELRKEDPEGLKEIITNIHIKHNTLIAENKMKNKATVSDSSKMKYIVEMIDEIKNNKYLKYNASEKFIFFKNFVNTHRKDFVDTEILADKIDIGLQKLKELDKFNLQDCSHINNEIVKSKTDTGIDDFQDDIVDSTKIDRLLKKFKMTTDLKKKIFTAIINSTDYMDAFERLTRLNLKDDQSREIIKIIVILAIEEKCYNPFYKLLIDKLIFVEKAHRYTFHYTIWDQMKIINTFTIKKLHNLAKLISDLLLTEKVSLPVFLPFEFENANPNQHTLVTYTFDNYFEQSDSDKTKMLFAKLVKNDSHVEFGKQLFNYLKNFFVKEIDLSKKPGNYLESYSAATRVLNKIL